LITTSNNDVANTLCSPNCRAKYPPDTGPKQNDKPNVANANPNAGARRRLSATQSEMYANVKGNVAEKNPEMLLITAYNTMLFVNAIKHTGNVVPTTVTNKQYLRPTRSLNRPNTGHATNANTPLHVSINPTATYDR